MTTIDDIREAAQSLSSTERRRLIAPLWDGLRPEDWPPPNEAWLQEMERHSDAYDAGRQSTSSWEDVRARSRRKAGLDG